ncbi:Vasotab [Frankliniella fusca]|uniref:Vasotab n=1 Tax=Frankliniella fusca TaxID=407009 RepID=A0AAE1GYS2_9NEOP|nr:Vasotab [Frankliniella fusca]
MSSIPAVALVCLAAEAQAGKFTPAPSKCPRCEDAPYEPVCVRTGGTEKEPKLTTFGSECVLRSYNCEKGTGHSVQKKGECPAGSPVRLS